MLDCKFCLRFFGPKWFLIRNVFARDLGGRGENNLGSARNFREPSKIRSRSRAGKLRIIWLKFIHFAHYPKRFVHVSGVRHLIRALCSTKFNSIPMLRGCQWTSNMKKLAICCDYMWYIYDNMCRVPWANLENAEQKRELDFSLIIGSNI